MQGIPAGRTSSLLELANRVPNVYANNSCGQNTRSARHNANERLNPIHFLYNQGLLLLLVTGRRVKEELIFLVAGQGSTVSKER